MNHVPSHRRRSSLAGLVVVCVTTIFAVVPVIADPVGATGGTSTIAGAVWQDLDRDGIHDAGEAGFSGVTVELYDVSGLWVTGVGTGPDGTYSIGGLADGTYNVRIRTSDWWSLRHDWVPTTTGSLFYKLTVNVSTSTATADFGLRPIIRSTTLGSPISSVRSATGTLVESYDDAVTAQTVLDHLQAGSLLGAEAPYTEVRFDFQEGGTCNWSISGSPGTFSGYGAHVWVDYLGWVNDGDRVLFHEYGHAWSNYYNYVVQQDGTFSGYLAARGVAGDARLGSSHAWTPAEMIAEDYRLLFGTPSAKAYPQENVDLPPADQVTGLVTYLRDTFTHPPAGGADPTPAPPTAPASAPLSVTGVAMTPAPVTTSGTASFALSGPATAKVSVLDKYGTVVRTLSSGASFPGGASSLPWDRLTDAGRKAKAGTYTLVVAASDATGTSVVGSVAFSVVDPTRTAGKH